MRKTTNQIDEATRRRSLLPQRSSIRQSAPRIDARVQQKLSEPEISDYTAIGSDRSRTAHRGTTSMLPPSAMGRSQSIREPARTSISRRPSAANAASQNLCDPLERAVTEKGPQSSVSRSFYGRSFSHQVERPVALAASASSVTRSRQSSMRDSRLPFTAMQQSFPPKKSMALKPPSSPSQVLCKDDISFTDCFHLQMELAQLHLLHRSAAHVQHEWEHSAEEKFRLRFAALAERHIDLKEIAQQQQALVNQLALVRWTSGTSGTQVAEKVELLSRNVAKICTLLEAEGKYTRILEVFESWFGQVLQIREQRKSKSRGSTALNFVEGIGDGWKAEAMVLERELTYCLRDLKSLGVVRADSSLGRILSLYSRLILDLVEEMDVIQWIENEISIQETYWVETTIQGLVSAVDHDLGTMDSMHSPARD